MLCGLEVECQVPNLGVQGSNLCCIFYAFFPFYLVQFFWQKILRAKYRSFIGKICSNTAIFEVGLFCKNSKGLSRKCTEKNPIVWSKHGFPENAFPVFHWCNTGLNIINLWHLPLPGASLSPKMFPVYLPEKFMDIHFRCRLWHYKALFHPFLHPEKNRG